MKMQLKIYGLLALAFMLALGPGCQGRRLELGGAYAPAVTNALGAVSAGAAPDMALFVADASYDLAYSGALTVFRIEKQNRALLKTLFPDLKRDLDQAREEVWRIDQQWALARQAYLLNPVPANLGAIERALAEMQRWNAAAAALLAQTAPP